VPTAAFQEQSSTGTVGSYEVPDAPGVVCHYEDNAGGAVDELDRVRIRPVTVNGRRAQKTWVGFRYILLANEQPFSDGKYRTVYKSPITKAKASLSEGIRFTGEYRTREAHRSAFQVQLVFLYYKSGSKTEVAGKTRGLVEVYRQRHPDVPFIDRGSIGDPGTCGAKVHG
jgi:hypothetical protein